MPCFRGKYLLLHTWGDAYETEISLPVIFDCINTARKQMKNGIISALNYELEDGKVVADYFEMYRKEHGSKYDEEDCGGSYYFGPEETFGGLSGANLENANKAYFVNRNGISSWSIVELQEVVERSSQVRMVIKLYIQESSTLLNEPDYNGEPLEYSVEGLSITSLNMILTKLFST